MEYLEAEDIKKIAHDIVKEMNWKHINLEEVAFLRSKGSSTRRTIARCHSLGKAMQIGMKREKGFYLIEVISEKFDRLAEKEKIKVVIHELMHIPKTFGGGFVQHHLVTEDNVEKNYKKFISLKNQIEPNFEKNFLEINKKEENQLIRELKKWF